MKLSDPPPSFTPAAEDLVVRFGRYEIIGELASGGMGTVYLARIAGEAGFQRLFALKIMHEHLARDHAFVEMLLDEARVTSRIHHPNIVPIVDLGKDQGRYFLVMDYIEGCSLAQLAVRHRDARDPSMIVPLIIDALEGLHAAHTLVDDDDQPLHLVHRDVSAQNIMVGVDGAARVIDFGIAKAEARISSTRPGVLKGKLALMSPEQLQSKEVDARADIFSAGAVLWSLLTGARLFRAESESATVHNILQKEVPPPSTVGLEPPACFDAICLKALARSPADRYQTAAEMAEDLRRAASENGLMASRADIAAWVKRSFVKEFAARREAVRQRASAIHVTLGDVQDIRVLPDLGAGTGPTGKMSSGVRGAVADSGSFATEATETLPARTPTPVQVIQAAPPTSRRTLLSVAALVIASGAIGALLVGQRQKEPAPQPIVVVSAPAQPAAEHAAPPRAEPAPTAATTTAPVTTAATAATATPATSAQHPKASAIAFDPRAAAPRFTPPAPPAHAATTPKPATPAPTSNAKEAAWDLDSPIAPQ